MLRQAALRNAGALPQLVQLLRRTDADGADDRAVISAAHALRNFADGPANRTAVRWDPSSPSIHNAGLQCLLFLEPGSRA